MKNVQPEGMQGCSRLKIGKERALTSRRSESAGNMKMGKKMLGRVQKNISIIILSLVKLGVHFPREKSWEREPHRFVICGSDRRKSPNNGPSEIKTRRLRAFGMGSTLQNLAYKVTPASEVRFASGEVLFGTQRRPLTQSSLNQSSLI